MSAIVGILFLDGRPVGREDLEQMTERVAHRGPDGSGIWIKGSVGLGHRMLWTTPESVHEKLPLENQSGELAITADVRIDNREELIAALNVGSYPTTFPSGMEERDGGAHVSDSRLILLAYERWGERCPEKLLGDFAFVIWDRRKQELFCARDRLGVKPLYYHRSERIFVFASEIKALLCLQEVPCRLNEVRVADHLAEIFEDLSITFYRDIVRLPAAHSLRVSRGEIKFRSYWSLDPSRELRLRSDAEYAEAFREVFTEAVRCRLRCAFPVGSMLSGGLDSSSIVCTARKLLAEDGGRRLHTFSAVFPSLPAADLRSIDERPFIDTVLVNGGLEPHYIHADRLSPLMDLDRVLWHEDEAFLAPNLYMHWAIYRAARQEGARVLLDGIDGDTTVSHGFEHLADLARTGSWKILIKEAIALSEKSSPSFPAWRIGWQYGIRPLVPEPVARFWRALRGRTRPPWGGHSVINPEFARRVCLAERAQTLRKNGSTSARTAREHHWHSLTSALIPYALELLDKASAAFTLEPRYPFFDSRLLEFCLALPPEQKLHRGWTRVIMRRAMAGILPAEVQWRPRKANLSSNFKRRLLDYERKTLDRVILDEPQTIEEYVDVPALRSAYERYACHPIARERDALTVYGTATLALWLRRTALTPQ